MAECHALKIVESKSRFSGQRRDSIGIEIAHLFSCFAGKKGKGFPLSPEIVAYNSAVGTQVRSKEGSDMLVLSRKLGEKIYINDNICITVVDIDRGKIRLGIEAPRNVPIFRQELLADGIHPKADVPVVAAKG